MGEKNQSGKGLFGRIMAFAGWGIGLASLIITVYTEFIRKNEPKLEYDIVSSTRFINNNETSASLRIFVDSLDVQESRLNISAFNIKIENKGTAHIRYDDYDKGPFGLVIQDGHLLEPPTLLDASSDHIRALFPQNDSITRASFVDVPNLSLDVDDYYIIHLVLLHSSDITPTFIPEGKIIGQQTIAFNTLGPPAPSFWSIVFNGNWLVHIVRSVIYLLSIIIVTVFVALMVSLIDESIGKRKRKKLLAELSKKTMIVPFVGKDFINNGSSYISYVNSMFIKNESDISTQYKKSRGFINSKRSLENNNINARQYHNNRYNKIRRMIDKGYLQLTADDHICFNEDAKRSVQSILSMLISKGLLKKDNNSPLFPGGVELNPLVRSLYELDERFWIDN